MKPTDTRLEALNGSKFENHWCFDCLCLIFGKSLIEHGKTSALQGPSPWSIIV